MLQKMRVLLLVCATFLLAGCPGGDGGGDSTPNFAGVYNIGVANLSSNACNLAVPSLLEVGTDVVTQNGRSIQIGQDGDNFIGSVDADNGGFSATFTEVVEGVPVLGSIAFRTATAGSTYAITFSITVGACTIVYKGTATKS